jgi:hypothetical protein
MRRFGAGYAERDMRRGKRIIRDYYNGAISSERYCRLSSGPLIGSVGRACIACCHDPGS